MADAFKHKRYFRLSEADGSTLVSFSSTSDANTKIGFAEVWSTSSPTKVETLEDSNFTLVVQYEFDSLDQENAFSTAVDIDNQYSPADSNHIVQCFKHVWFGEDGTTEVSTSTFSADDYSW